MLLANTPRYLDAAIFLLGYQSVQGAHRTVCRGHTAQCAEHTLGVRVRGAHWVLGRACPLRPYRAYENGPFVFGFKVPLQYPFGPGLRLPASLRPFQGSPARTRLREVPGVPARHYW